jgi:YgiT-type zinc finger domain-containing protein
MKCVICKNTNIEFREIQEQINIGNNIVIIPLKIHICQNCGEKYFTRNDLKKIEEVKDKITNKKIDYEEIGKVLLVHTI